MDRVGVQPSGEGCAKAEAAGLDMVLIADNAPASAGDAVDSLMPFEATTLLAALGDSHDEHRTGGAASTVAHQPYNLARRFASLDIISHGPPAGTQRWRRTRAKQPISAGRPGSPTTISAAAPRNISASCRACGRGWDADALLFDKSSGRFHDPEKMHLLDHKGEFFSVRGPLNVARSPQDTPVLGAVRTVGTRPRYRGPRGRRCPARRRTDRDHEAALCALGGASARAGATRMP